MKPTQQTSPAVEHEEAPEAGRRLGVLKTYKLYINGKFPRTESGHYYKAVSPNGEALANMCRGSRKDFRDAVRAARAAQASWASASAYLRGQVLYRVAEMLEGRAGQFASELVQQGADPSEARTEVTAAIDRLVYYAGWADKYQQVFSSVNPVASSHFNFSILEPTGVVSILAPQDTSLIGLVTAIAPALVGGNAVIVHPSQARPLCAITFAEVLHTSDVPPGVVNIITGLRDDLVEHFASHMDVNACVYCGDDAEELRRVRTAAIDNVKRVVHHSRKDGLSEDAQSPYFILDTQEVKTTWHPIGV